MPEADLYAPIKRFLEAQGYIVKGEIGPCDIVAVRGEDDPVVVELKERLNLALVLQAVDRLHVSPAVYIAFRIGEGHSASWRSRRKQVTSLLRRLGLGLLTVSGRGQVVPVLDPAPYRPKPDACREEADSYHGSLVVSIRAIGEMSVKKGRPMRASRLSACAICLLLVFGVGSFGQQESADTESERDGVKEGNEWTF